MSDWRDQALCAQVDPDLWFPEKGESVRAARRICEQCPVQRECLNDALTRSEQFGIWGGLSYHQRRVISPERLLQAERAGAHQRLISVLTPAEAAQELGVSARTVQRWRATLREAS